MDQTISERQLVVNAVTQELAKSVISDMRQAAGHLDIVNLQMDYAD